MDHFQSVFWCVLYVGGMFLSSCGSECSLSLGEDVSFAGNGAIGASGTGGALFVVNADALQPADQDVSAACSQEGSGISGCSNITSTSSSSSSSSGSQLVELPKEVLAAMEGKGNYVEGESYGPDLATMPVQLGRPRAEQASLNPSITSSSSRSSRSSSRGVYWGGGICGAEGQELASFAWLDEVPLAVESGVFFDFKVRGRERGRRYAGANWKVTVAPHI